MSLIAVETQVLQEIVFVSVLSEDFEDADHLVVPVGHQLVEEWHCRVLYHSKHRVFTQDLVLKLHDTIDILHVVRVLVSDFLLVIQVDIELGLHIVARLTVSLTWDILFALVMRYWLVLLLQLIICDHKS